MNATGLTTTYENQMFYDGLLTKIINNNNKIDWLIFKFIVIGMESPAFVTRETESGKIALIREEMVNYTV